MKHLYQIKSMGLTASPYILYEWRSNGGDGGRKLIGGLYGLNRTYPPPPSHHNEVDRSTGQQEPPGGVGGRVYGGRDGLDNQPLLSLEYLDKNKVISVKRPDHGGTLGSRCSLLVNRFPVTFSKNTTVNPARSPLDKTAHAGEKNILGVVNGEDSWTREENSSRCRNLFGMINFAGYFKKSDDQFPDFKKSLKDRSKGLAMCSDDSVMPPRMSVIDYLKKTVNGFQEVHDVCSLIHEVTEALKGLKVTATHHKTETKQKYTIAGLTEVNAEHLMFYWNDTESQKPRYVDLASYFKRKYQKDIELGIPCLDVGNHKRKNYLPIEFAMLADEQPYEEKSNGPSAGVLTKTSMLPRKRRGKAIKKFNKEDCTKVAGRVIEPPNLVVGNGITVTLQTVKCQFNFLSNSVIDGKELKRWALIDFISSSPGQVANDIAEGFAKDLVRRCRDMGIQMKDCLVLEKADMSVLSDVDQVGGLLNSVIAKASQEIEGGTGLQLIVCVMAKQDPGYKNLKWVSETQIGVLTQCCLMSNYEQKKDKLQRKEKFLTNLALKINAKLGGINFELKGELPFFGSLDGVMFIGADVNHPAPSNTQSPSIAAVVATISLENYIARVYPQEPRKEKIVNFGSICLDLVNTYALHKGAKPNKLVVFREWVSEGQFDMVVKEELLDLKKAIYEDFYLPTITVVVVQKRHQTHLLLDNERDGVFSGNVLPGTVVDIEIVQPFKFDFYLCSHHFGQSGSSKPTHYYVQWDENGFSSDKIQELIYHLCFTFACSTKPLSLVPPVHYADIVARRGRMFQEVMEENPLSRSFSTSSVSSSSSDSSDAEFFKLHPDLEDFMVFI